MSYRFDCRGALLPKVLAGIILLFLGILLATFLVARRVNVVMLDEKGHVRYSLPATP